MSITNLPTELINKICENLDPSDWHSLRMSSKALNKKTLMKFGDYHCETIRMIVTSDGLRRLEEIAQHEIFRMRARELVILPTLFGNYDNMSYECFVKSPFGKPSWPRCQWRDSDLDSRYKRYQAAAADHRNALNDLEKTLARCLPRFENLDAFSLQSTSARSLLNPEALFDCLGLRQFKTQLECQVQQLVQLGNAEVGKVNAFALSALWQEPTTR